MKKITIIMVLFSMLCMSCISTGETTASDIMPSFDKPYSIVLDAWESGSKKYSDYVKFYNSTKHEHIGFNVYGYNKDKGTWVIIGATKLDKYNDSDTINSPYNDKLYNFRYFAIQSLNDLNFSASVYVKNNDIHFIVFE